MWGSQSWLPHNFAAFLARYFTAAAAYTGLSQP
jgi:hypothetical protein